MEVMSKLDNKLNSVLDNFFDVWIPILYRLMVIAVIALAFLGVIMATQHFDLMNPDLVGGLPTWDSILSWPFTVAPLWWKLSFFIMGGLILFPRLLTIRD